jgi:3'-5' exoribonuclease
MEHVLSLMELAAIVAPRYNGLDRDLLLMGAFIHDIGKVRELTYDPDLGYTDAGQLIGHLVQGINILDEKIQETEKQSGESFPAEMANRLKHMIVSHHGQYEFGSPKLPMTMEALALHYLDTMDAKLHNVWQLIEEDVNKESAWTVYNAPLARKFYKGQLTW